ncbi:hypothetical protein FSP39_012855, partial [Pinctada imbricata]
VVYSVTTSTILIRFSCMITVLSLYQYGTVYCENRKCSYKAGSMDFEKGTAVGVYNDTLETTGWGILDIASGYGAETSDSDIMYAAGYVEGYLTAKRIYQHYQNMKDYFLTSRIK